MICHKVRNGYLRKLTDIPVKYNMGTCYRCCWYSAMAASIPVLSKCPHLSPILVFIHCGRDMPELMERSGSVDPMVYIYCSALLHVDTAVKSRLCDTFQKINCCELGICLRHTVCLRIQNKFTCHRLSPAILS